MRASAAWADSRVVPPCQSTQTCSGQFLFFQQLVIGIPYRRLNVRVFHRGHSFAVQGVDHAENSIAPLLRRWRRNERDHGFHGRLLQDTRGYTLRIAVNGPGWRIGGCGGNVRQPQCLRDWRLHSVLWCA